MHPFVRTLLLCLAAANSVAAETSQPTLADAIETRNYTAIEHLLKQGTRPAPLAEDNEAAVYTHPLALAISMRDARSVELLLNAGVGKGELHRFVLMLDKAPAVLKLLLAHGLSPDASVMKTSLLGMAALSGDLDSVAVLLERGARADTSDDRGNTPLHSAMTGGGPQRGAIAERLMTAGVKVDGRNQAGQTALHLAAAAGDEKTIDLLLVRGLTMSDTDAAGVTAFGYLYSSSRSTALHSRYPRQALSDADRLFALREAAEMEAIDAFELLATPADVVAHPEWLITSIQRDNYKMLHTLLAVGADPAVRDEDDRPLFIEKLLDSGAGGKVTAHMLIAAGARVQRPLSTNLGDRIAYLDAGDAEKILWLRAAGVALDMPVEAEEEAMQQQALLALLKERRGSELPEAWHNELPQFLRHLRPSFGQGLSERRELLVGTWENTEEQTRWSFTADGRFTALQNVLFAEDRSRGRWTLSNAGLTLEVESDKPGTRRLLPILWLADEMTVAQGLGPVTLRRSSATPSDVAGPAVTSLTDAEICGRAASSFKEATIQIKNLLASNEGVDTQVRQGMQQLASVDPGDFETHCVRDYRRNPWVARFAGCLLDFKGVLGLIGCVGMAQEAPANGNSAVRVATPLETAGAPFRAIMVTESRASGDEAAPAELRQFIQQYQLASSATNMDWYERALFDDASMTSVDSGAAQEVKEQLSKTQFIERSRQMLPLFRIAGERCSKVAVKITGTSLAVLERECISLAQTVQSEGFVIATQESVRIERRRGHWGIADSNVRMSSSTLFRTDAQFDSDSSVFDAARLPLFLSQLEQVLAGDFSSSDTAAILAICKTMRPGDESSLVYVHTLAQNHTPLQLRISVAEGGKTQIAYSASTVIFPQIQQLARAASTLD